MFTLRPGKDLGFYVKYLNGEVKYSRKPFEGKIFSNDYGTLLSNQLKDGTIRIPAKDAILTDTRTLFR